MKTHRAAIATQTPASRVISSDVSDATRLASEARRNAIQNSMGPQDVSGYETEALAVVPGQIPSGTTPKLMLEARDKQQFLFKKHIERNPLYDLDVLANALRSAAKEPVVPMFGTEVATPEGKVSGYVKMMLPVKGVLTHVVANWTPQQTDSVLADAPWFEFLGNYDSKVSQYVVLEHEGEEHALNVDWDHALGDYEANKGPLTRFKNAVLCPTATGKLFYEYVRGRVDVDFEVLFEAVERIEKIPEETIKKNLAPVLEKLFAAGNGTYGPYSSPQEVVDDVLARQAGLRQACETLVQSLVDERLERTGQVPTRSHRARAKNNLKDFFEIRVRGRMEISKGRRFMNWIIRSGR